MSLDEEALRRAFAALQKRVEYLERATGIFVADASLDRPKGDPVVKFAPRGWRGPNFVDKRYSQCSPDFLEFLADALTSMAENPQPGKESYAGLNRKTAARARSWARRLRAKTLEPREVRATAQAPAVAVGPEAGQRDPPPPTRGAAGAPSRETALFDDETGEVLDDDPSGGSLFEDELPGHDSMDDLFR